MYVKFFFPSSKRGPPISTLLLVSFLLVVVVCGNVVSGAAVLRERQDEGVADTGTGTVVSSTTRTGRDSTTMTTTATPSRGSGSRETDEPTAAGDQTGLSSTLEPVPTLINYEDDDVIDPDIAPVYSGDGLPIMPKVTPGIAVAGVLLMLAGLPMCLIGIKQKKVQIFLSVAYLCSLGVTVLIVYVMNPPVKNAIQGAYVVAATITGLFFGAIAVIFPEVTEKLGCLLGGFCLSMWFLVLKPGGLIDSTYGKLIMIAAFSLTVFLLAFHRLTKPYALISACSFSGATSIVLGIDCFSRAGLKEFWLYIWALNDSIFPLNTYTYPHTRGMRVEIAIILIITVVGIMSQMKLWKIIRERREQKRAEREREQNDVEKLNEDVGRRVEEEDRRERAEWEKIYGNADSANKESRPDSGVGSRTGSGVTLMDDDGIKEVPGSIGKGHTVKERDTQIQVTSVPIEDKDIEVQTDNPVLESIQTVAMGSGESVQVSAAVEGAVTGLELAPIEEEEPDSSTQTESDSPPPPPPPPILVRQHIPYIPNEEDREDDAMSVATYADTISHTVHLQNLNKNDEIHIETIDANTVDPSEEALTADNASAEPGLQQTDTIAKVEQSEVPDREKCDELFIAVTGPREEGASVEAEGTVGVSTRTQQMEEHKSTFEEHKVASTVSGELKISSINSGEKTNSSPASLADLDTLQNHCSRIHKTYRTNEWAKHLADAEAVELDDLTPYFEEGIPEEVPVPVLVNQLQEITENTSIERKPKLPKSRIPSQEYPLKAQTPLSFAVTAAPPHVASVPAPLPSPAATPPPVSMTPKPVLKPSSTPTISESEVVVTEKPVVQHRASLPPPSRAMSPTPPTLPTPSRAMSPTPPILPPPSRAMSPTPAIPYENTLIGRRESILKMRPSMLIQEQMIRAASPSGYQNSAALADTVSVHNMGAVRLTPMNMDDMTLSQRREFLLNQQAQQGGTPLQSRTGTPMPQLSPRNSFGINPPSPTIGAAAKQKELLQAWRESLKQDTQISQQSQVTWGERKVIEALNEKQQTAIFKKEKEAEKIQRDAIVEERMRSPMMLNAHREKMRKFQASASTH